MFVHLIHAVCSPLSLYIVLKFAFYSWQVPCSLVGRALYRESGPSQDGDPVPGNLSLHYISEGFLPLTGKFTLFLHS